MPQNLTAKSINTNDIDSVKTMPKQKKNSGLGRTVEGTRASRKLKKIKTTAPAASDDPESSSSHLNGQSQTLPLHLHSPAQEHEEAPIQAQDPEAEEEEALDPEVCLNLQERKAWQTQRSLLLPQSTKRFCKLPPKKILMELMELLT
jgi:hypothetical protein